MNIENLVAFLAAARSGQILEVDSAVLEQYDLDGSVLNLTVEDLADYLVALRSQMQAEHQQAELQIVQLAQLKIERLQRDLEAKAAQLEHERDWSNGQIQALTHKCEQYEAILPGLSHGNTRWMSFRTCWWMIGLLFLALLAFKANFAVDSLIFTIGWIASYSGVFLGKLFGYLRVPLRNLIPLPAARRHVRLERDNPQPVRVA